MALSIQRNERIPPPRPLMSQNCYYYTNPENSETRNSAIADKPRDAFRGQSRSSNI